MGQFTLSQHIDAPRTRVWEMAADCSLIAQWNVSYTAINDCSGRLDQVGAGYNAVTRILGRSIEGHWEVTEVDPGRKVVLRGTSPLGGHAMIILTLTDAGDGTDTSTQVDYELPGGLFAGVMERLTGGAVERDVRHSAENFKALCEALVTAAT